MKPPLASTADATLDGRETELQETLQRLKECVESAQYFEALQQYQSLAQRRKQAASKILSHGASEFLKKRQEKEGLELGILLIDHLNHHDTAGEQARGLVLHHLQNLFQHPALLVLLPCRISCAQKRQSCSHAYELLENKARFEEVCLQFRIGGSYHGHLGGVRKLPASGTCHAAKSFPVPSRCCAMVTEQQWLARWDKAAGRPAASSTLSMCLRGTSTTLRFSLRSRGAVFVAVCAEKVRRNSFSQ